MMAWYSSTNFQQFSAFVFHGVIRVRIGLADPSPPIPAPFSRGTTQFARFALLALANRRAHQADRFSRGLAQIFLWRYQNMYAEQKCRTVSWRSPVRMPIHCDFPLLQTEENDCGSILEYPPVNNWHYCANPILS